MFYADRKLEKNERQYPNYEIMQHIQIMKYILFKDFATVHVTCVMCIIQVLNFIVHKEFSGTSWSEYLMHMGLKV